MQSSRFKQIVSTSLYLLLIMFLVDIYVSIQTLRHITLPAKQTTNAVTNNFISLPAPIRCRITYYTSQESETDSDPFITANMDTPIVGETCAVSPDLIRWLGGKIYIEGIGIRKVNDLTHERFVQTIDIYADNSNQAKKFSGRKLVTFLGR